jgi:hypothetical protein
MTKAKTNTVYLVNLKTATISEKTRSEARKLAGCSLADDWWICVEPRLNAFSGNHVFYDRAKAESFAKHLRSAHAAWGF